MNGPGPAFAGAAKPERLPAVEWITLGLVAGCYAVLACATTWASQWWLPAGMVATTLAIALFSSLQHEVLHGHPFRIRRLNEALVFAGVTVFIPYGRFRDTHLAHHHDPVLTDPYDDPESNYLDPRVWHRMSALAQMTLRFNNTLFGRILIGPAVSMWSFVRGDLAAIRGGDKAVLRAWLLHVPGLALVWLWLVGTEGMSVGAYLVCAYLGFGILKIRTFLEHRAHEHARARSVVVEDRGLLSFLFLNNNFHAVHHAHPGVAWYRLPALYATKRDHFLRCNEDYRYRSYAEIFRQHFFHAKDPVPHPLRPRD